MTTELALMLSSLEALTREALDIALAADIHGTCRRLTEQHGLSAVMRRFWEVGLVDPWDEAGSDSEQKRKLRMVMFVCMGWPIDGSAPNGWNGVSKEDLKALHDLLAEMGVPVRERFRVLNGDGFVDPMLINRWMEVAPLDTVVWTNTGMTLYNRRHGGGRRRW